MSKSKVNIINPVVNYKQSLSNLEVIIPGGGVLRAALIKALTQAPFKKANSIKKNLLPSNVNIVEKEICKIMNKALKNKLNRVLKITEKEPIILIRDECITNDRLCRILKTILGEDLDKLVKIINVNFTKPAGKELVEEINNNSIIIIGGSRTNVFDINEKGWIQGEFADFIKNVISLGTSTEINNCLLGICHGQSYLLQLINLLNSDNTNITVTNKGPAHFGPAVCKINNINNMSYHIRMAMAGLTNFGKNNKITGACTRTNKNNFDILNMGGNNQVNVLANEELTNDPIIWSSENNNVIGTYLHPEINFIKNPEEITTIMDSLTQILKYEYSPKDIKKIISNFEGIEKYVGKDIGEAFYSFVLFAFITMIEENLDVDSWSPERTDYAGLTKKVINETSYQLNNLLLKNESWESKQHREKTNWQLGNRKTKIEFLEKIDKAGGLVLNAQYGRIVNRGIKEVGMEFGIHSIDKLFQEIIDHMNKHSKEKGSPKNTHIIRDLGCGNGTFIEQFDKVKDKSQNIVLQGVSKEIPFDLLQGMLSSDITKKHNIPNDILEFINILICQKYDLNKCENKTLKEEIYQIISNLKTNHLSSLLTLNNELKIYEYGYSLPFYRNIFRPKKLIHKLKLDSYKFLDNNLFAIKELLNDIKENFYHYFNGYVERILLSKFSNFKIQDPQLAQSSITFSSKGTSQVGNPGSYLQIGSNFITKYSRLGSVNFDNGVMASYTSIPRINELKKLKEQFGKRIKIKLLYNRATNYFNGAIIMVYPFVKDEIYEKYLLKDFEDNEKGLKIDSRLVELEEAYNCTYFKRERFLRDYLLVNFRSFDVFWDFKNDINKFLKDTVEMIEKGLKDEIKIKFIQLINKIVGELNLFLKEQLYNKIEYNPININTLESYYDFYSKKNINDIIDSPFFMPEWININGQRLHQ